jgi:peptide/nickel transport system permease protein
MAKYITKRLLYLIPMLFCVILMVFLIMSLTPGDPASNVLPMTASNEVKQAFNESVGYTGPLLERFGRYLKGLFTGEVISYSSGNNVLAELGHRIPITLRLGLISFAIASVLGIALGIISAVKQYSFFDTVVTVFAVLLASIPAFFVAVCLVLYFAIGKGWLPAFGLDGFTSYILPVTTIVLSQIPILSRMTRSTMLDAINQDYIRTARAKGCSEKLVICKHALKNASLPIITLLLSSMAAVLGGSVIVEQIFTIPGVGMYMLAGINEKNVPVVMTCALLLSLVFMISMVLMDISYALVDPKIRARYKK